MKRESGQGIVEYALILVLFSVIVITFLFVIGSFLDNDRVQDPLNASYYYDRYQECLATEKYDDIFCAAWVTK